MLALITGAGRGIGRAAAVALAKRGYDVALVARSADELRATADEVTALGRRARTFALDVTDADAPDRLARELGPRLDALVNNAGSARQATVPETDAALFRGTLELNLVAPFLLARALWPALSAAKGAVVNVGSVAARDPFEGFHAYAASKAALGALTLTLAREGAPLGVRAFCVAPAGVDTPALRALAAFKDVPADKVLAPDEVGAVIAELCAGSLAHACSGETVWLHRGVM